MKCLDSIGCGGQQVLGERQRAGRLHSARAGAGSAVTTKVLRAMLGLAVVFMTVLRAAVAQAEADAAARAVAVQLFDEARALFVEERFSEACPKYAESYRLDPQLGALLHLGECYERNKQLASAWGSFRDAEEMAIRLGDARAEMASERAKSLQPRLSYLTIDVPQTVVVPGLSVSRDGAAVPKVLWGARAAVDAGTYRIAASAPGYTTWQTEVTVGDDAAVAQITVARLARAPVTSDPTQDAARSPSTPGTSQRIAAIAVGGLGLVGVGVGGFLGLSAQASLSDSKELCNDQNYCTSRGDELRSSAKSKALAATVVTGVGAAAIVTATVLWFTAPRNERLEASPQRARRSWAIVPSDEAWGVGVQHVF